MCGRKRRSLIQAHRARAKARPHMISLVDGRFGDKSEFRDRNYLIPGRAEPIGGSIDPLHQSEKAKIAAFNDRFGLNR
jgi:hypothetical protein